MQVGGAMKDGCLVQESFGVNEYLAKANLAILSTPSSASLCSADGSTHTESNKLYRKVKYRYRSNISPRQRPTAKARHDQAALAASAEARGATHRARPRSPSHTRPPSLPALTALAQHISHSHSGIDEKRPTEKFVL